MLIGVRLSVIRLSANNAFLRHDEERVKGKLSVGPVLVGALSGEPKAEVLRVLPSAPALHV